MIHLIKRAKKNYYNKAIKENLDKPKNLWKIIRNISPTKCVNLPNHVVINDKQYSNASDIANLFNEHFSNITNSVQIDPVPECLDWCPLTNFINSRIPLGISFSIPPISNDFVLDKLSHLATGKAAGLDDVSGFFLKAASQEIH